MCGVGVAVGDAGSDSSPGDEIIGVSATGSSIVLDTASGLSVAEVVFWLLTAHPVIPRSNTAKKTVTTVRQ